MIGNIYNAFYARLQYKKPRIDFRISRKSSLSLTFKMQKFLIYKIKIIPTKIKKEMIVSCFS